MRKLNGDFMKRVNESERRSGGGRETTGKVDQGAHKGEGES